jgi:hypothetical protein
MSYRTVLQQTSPFTPGGIMRSMSTAQQDSKYKKGFRAKKFPD